MATNTISHHTSFDDFPVGTRVRVVSEMVDFSFFGGDTGVVVRNSGLYLGIIVKFDRERWIGDSCHKGCDDRSHYDWIQTEFNFGPDNLLIEGEILEGHTFPDTRSIFDHG